MVLCLSCGQKALTEFVSSKDTLMDSALLQTTYRLMKNIPFCRRANEEINLPIALAWSSTRAASPKALNMTPRPDSSGSTPS